METFDKALQYARDGRRVKGPKPQRLRPADKYTVVYRRLKQRAKRKGFAMTLTETWIRERFEAAEYCEVSGIRLEPEPAKGPFSPSLDRIDNSLGYTPENVQLVCWMYNAAKGPFTHEDVMRLANSLTGP